MPQSSTIAFGLLVGFIVFITMRGELPAYLNVIKGVKQQPSGGLGALLNQPPLIG